MTAAYELSAARDLMLGQPGPWSPEPRTPPPVTAFLYLFVLLLLLFALSFG